ncbi:MAG: PRC-barrel domain-containing protein [Rhizobiales bacterium]|nr:PRC-barrel domain-containing protein [Hyphomicrobiales bacterium]OJY44503.1 MAG: hypothetical protein BGP08_13905 [Rhizobiales bacterium 64-17]
MKRTLIAAAAATLMTGAAFAQTTTPQNNTGTMDKPPAAVTTDTKPADATKPMEKPGTTGAATTTSSAGMAASSGFVMGKTATVSVRYANAKPADLMTSKLIGVNVYNSKDEKLGDIKDIAISNGNTVDGVVISVGGFLGMGESYVLVQPAAIALNNDNGTWKAYINADKDSLKNAPKFTYSKNQS